ncbi:MAG: hypothetical protein EBR82_07940 [Caulobacteraceae bacterium]|nr:hypothetical protein [Caulobacteraceae bacterium]
MKNREFETLTEAPLPGDGKVRVWRTQSSLEAACAAKNEDVIDVIWRHADAPWRTLALALEEIEGVSAIAITDCAGNGITLYPDWK